MDNGYKNYRVTYYDYEDEQHYSIDYTSTSESKVRDLFYKDHNYDVDITTVQELL